ncbi:Rtf2 RING-finger-domain-containing protein [Dichomitus squalens]|uniref:Rtf2 RING-finger-domain-containing protein n=1 Tax=Dichomitus squalens TaxID=114155 RepID=A0A4Q9PPS0_9APHY|nr:Rtf2 RING-finger-domain-containing protein [Dichomitus squalens]
MGNDGGSIPDRRDLVRSKKKAEQADKANQVRAMWFFCALSKRLLQEPIVSCPLGKLYNRDAILEFLLDRESFGAEGEVVCGHIRSIKDVKTLKLTHNASKSPPSASSSESQPERAPFVCPLNFKEMNGVQPFVYLKPCGCVFSQSGLRAVAQSNTAPKSSDTQPDGDEAGGADKPWLDLCPQCGTKYDRIADVLQLNPPPEMEQEMRATMEVLRSLEPVKSKSKKRKAAVAGDADQPAKKKAAGAAAATNPSIAAASRAVTQELAKEEARRKAAMSDAVKSLYGPKDGSKRKETFMTMGTFTRYA